ncbi:MAG: hypothetical protein KUF77_07260 [Candidatus Thiodiazotropha sp. (ex Lucina aurantia)]|nr:hypothetical protein [Candidatus Thiodiazotropha taylori]MBV2099655.1 hypothetical protein [Candidatus Thiodiazotropha sp. (ex Codakia orbicularis)]MBV2102807.1 hypothetical protein [Candidatus Thiodiazotropha sp. (ex Lucina aurantia)]MBV2117377.1 hypothetical protein [Candidatus Thiodiazotropha sp. (ex Lucina aurantia)]
MSKNWPQGSQDYIEQLKALGKVLARNPTLGNSSDGHMFRAFGGELFRVANTALGFNGGRATISTEPNLVFQAQLDKGLPKEGHAEIVIGGTSRFSDGTLSEQAIHFLILFTPSADVNGLQANTKYIVRKVHFDLDRQNTHMGKPTSHMQVGGNISHQMIAHTGDPERVKRETFDQLDLPRIPSPPYGLASVIDMALREFAPPSLKELTGERSWNELVSQTETVLLSSYHGRLYDELKSRASRTNYAYHCEDIICDI